MSPNLPSGTVWTKGGPLMASADELYITVTGKGGHASTPYLANDPMPVAAEIVQALQVLVTRRINTFDPVVITITQMNAGTTNNVIPEAVHLVGTLRGVSEAGRKQATDGDAPSRRGHRRRRTRCSAELYVKRGYPVTSNDDDSASFALSVASELLGEDAAGRMPTPVMGAEDFSYVLQQTPGAMSFLGVCPPGRAAGACTRVPLEPNDARRGRAPRRDGALCGTGDRVPRARHLERRDAIASTLRQGG